MTKKYVPTIAVDFDGVIHSYVSGWKGAHVIPDPPVEGAIEWLWFAMQERDLKIVIYSTRASGWRGRRAIRNWFREHAPNHWHEDGGGPGLEFIEITAKKPPAVVYIDDRGYRFEGIFPKVEELLAMKPWKVGGEEKCMTKT